MPRKDPEARRAYREANREKIAARNKAQRLIKREVRDVPQ